VKTNGRLSLAEGFGEAGGPQLAFGDSAADPNSVSQLDATIFLSPDGCTPGTDGEWSGGYGSACLGGGSVFASIYGDRAFVTALQEGVTVESPRQVDPEPFIPEAEVTRGLARVPLTFPDGSAVTLTYPSTFGLVAHGVQPDTAYESKRTGLVPIMFVHGPAGAEGRYLRGVSPVASEAGPDGEVVPLWEAVPLHESSIDPTHWLVRHAGSWTILIGVRDPVVADEVAASVDVHVSVTGMPWIEPLGGYSLSPFAGEGGGTVLTIGDLEPSPRSQRLIPDFANFATVEITPRPCNATLEERSLDVNGQNLYGTLCLADGRVIASVYAERAFADGLIDTMRIDTYEPA